MISDQGGHVLNEVIDGLMHHYAVIHKKSTLYYPQDNGQTESTNKRLQNILPKIVNDHRPNWGTKLSSPLWAYRTSFKMSVQSTPFRLAFGMEAVMPVEFQIPSLHIQVKGRLLEKISEQVRLQQLLEKQDRVRSVAILEQEQQHRKAFVDQHRGRN